MSVLRCVAVLELQLHPFAKANDAIGLPDECDFHGAGQQAAQGLH